MTPWVGTNRLAGLSTLAVGLLGMAVVDYLGVAGPADPVYFVALVLAYVAVEAIPLQLPRGDVLYFGVGVATASLLIVHPANAVFAMILGLGLAATSSGSPVPARLWGKDLGRRLVALLLAATVHSQLVDSIAPGSSQLSALTPALLGGVTYAVLDLTWFSLSGSRALGETRLQSAFALFRMLGGLYLGQISVALAVAIVRPGLGSLGVVVLLTLMLLMQHSFGLLLKVRLSYTMTVTALAQLPELQDGGSRGHADRVAMLAVAVARRMGMRGSALERISLAALLHDIGNLGVEGSVGDDASSVALRGARLLESVSILADLAPVLAMQDGEAVRGAKEGDVLAANIVARCSAFADRLGAEYSESRARDALVAMSCDDPDDLVAAALDAVVESGALPGAWR